jgi:capsular exopolysaccharide synthesis family protein
MEPHTKGDLSSFDTRSPGRDTRRSSTVTRVASRSAEQGEQVELKHYIQIARKYWWLLVIGTMLGASLGLYSAETTQIEYRGSVTFFVRTAGEGTASAANLGDQFAQRRVNSYIALLQTDRLATMIIDDTGLELTPGQVRGKISGRSNIDTVLLTATVTDISRERALDIAESLSRQFVQLVSEVEGSGDAGGEATVHLELVSGPAARVLPIPRTTMVATRAMLGLVLAAVIAFIMELLDNRVRSVDQLLSMSDAPILGLITFDRRARQAPLIIRDDALSVRAESYRQLRTNLQFVDLERHVQVVVITSSVPGEGKSMTAANLAIAMSQSKHRVLLIDADLRRPKAAEMFSVEQSVGLTDVLVGRVSFDDALQPWGTSGLVILPSGTIPPNPSELLGTVAMHRLLDEAKQRFDMILIDTPPLIPVTDAAVVASAADGVVLVVRFDKATKGQVDRAIALLERVNAVLLGYVGSMVPQRGIDGYGVYGGDYMPDVAPTTNGSKDDEKRRGVRARRAKRQAKAARAKH